MSCTAVCYNCYRHLTYFLINFSKLLCGFQVHIVAVMLVECTLPVMVVIICLVDLMYGS